jgi:hypothetical protein
MPSLRRIANETTDGDTPATATPERIKAGSSTDAPLVGVRLPPFLLLDQLPGQFDDRQNEQASFGFGLPDWCGRYAA